MNLIIFFDLEEVIRIHDKQILIFGGATGIRDQNLLISAINMPQCGVGGSYLYSDIYQMAAAYMYYIIKNHPFIDGNKRTGVVVGLAFLVANKIEVRLSQEQVFDYALQIATSKLSIEELATLLRD